MSARTAIPSQRLRIAIGLTALKFKPSEQSIQSYTLELKHHFRHSALSSGSEECDAWRDRVLALEAELETTRAAASSEHIELLALKSAASVSAQNSQVPEPTSSAAKKGKPPKKSRRRTSDPKGAPVPGVCPPPSGSTPRFKRKTPESCATRSRPSSPSPRKNHGLFSSLHALDAVSAAKADPALVVAATIRCIDVLHSLLARATSPAPDTPANPTPHEALNGIERTLPYVLRIAIGTLDGVDIDSAAGLRWQTDTIGGDGNQAQRRPNDTFSALDLVLGRIVTSLLVPAIRAIVPCTLARTENVLSSSSKGREYADAADLLGLVGAALEVLSGPVHVALHDRVALEAVRALVSLIAEGPPAQRIHRIARKDALHFLCDAALLSLCRTPPAAVPPGSAGELMGLALEAALGELALTPSAREGKSGLDTVEGQRVLVVIERAWNVGRRVGNIGGDAGTDKSMDARQGEDVDVTMTDVDGEDQEGNDQRQGDNTEPTANGF